MAQLFYRQERDSDFFNVCEKIRKEDNKQSVSEIVAKAIKQPAKSFYLNRREYAVIIRYNGNKLPVRPVKKELHREILTCYQKLKAENPLLDITAITKKLIDHPAPRFYISHARAVSLYYEILKKK